MIMRAAQCDEERICNINQTFVTCRIDTEYLCLRLQVRLPVQCQSRSYSILPVLLIVWFLLIWWTMRYWVLRPYLPILGNRFVKTSSAHLIGLWPCNYEKIKTWYRSTWRRAAIYRLQMQKLQRNLWQHGFIQAAPNTPVGASLRHKVQDAPIPAIWRNSSFSRAATSLQGYCGTGHIWWDIGIRILIILHYSHYSPGNNKNNWE